MSELDELVARYSTPREQLSPEVRQRLETIDAWEIEQEATGRNRPPHPLLDDNTAPGLDETRGYRPFWTDRRSD
jgi:hypothetical protein